MENKKSPQKAIITLFYISKCIMLSGICLVVRSLVGLCLLKDLVLFDSISTGAIILIMGIINYTYAKKLAYEDENQ
ncbi:MAG: hypothetical protein RR253_06095 [Oscillospiraceae bacterium]